MSDSQSVRARASRARAGGNPLLQRATLQWRHEHAARLAILDELTEGIDANGAAHVYDVMSGLSKAGITLIICSHDNKVLKGAHHVLDLDDGERPVMRSVTY